MHSLQVIETSYEKMVDFYLQLKDQNPMYVEDVQKLKEMHENVLKSIGQYFVFLDKEGIPRGDSYITHWLTKGFVYDRYEDEICYFLQHHLDSC